MSLKYEPASVPQVKSVKDAGGNDGQIDGQIDEKSEDTRRVDMARARNAAGATPNPTP